MQKTWIVVLLIAAMVMTAGGVAHAKRVATIEEKDSKRTFIVSDEIVRIPDVPRGIDDQTADSLFTGKIGSTLVEDQIGRMIGSFAFPQMSIGRTYSDTIVSYKNGRFSPRPLPIRQAPSRIESLVGTVAFIVFPILIIALVSVLCSAIGWRLWRLALFYILAIIFFVIGFEAPPAFDGLLQYLLFLLSVCANSFILAWGVTVFRQARKDLREAFTQKSEPKKSTPIPKRETMTIIACNGDEIVVDISDEAIAELCRQAGIKPMRHGERFDGKYGQGTVMGVAPRGNKYSERVLWNICDDDNGEATFFGPLCTEDMRPI